MDKYAASILFGLSFLHVNGVVHGDVRPQNVLVRTAGRAKLRGFSVDYMLARHLFALRWWSYVSPEVAAGGPMTPAADVYCAGLVVLNMAACRSPWRWADLAAADQTRTELDDLIDECGDAFFFAVGKGEIVPALPLSPEDAALTPFLRAILVATLHADLVIRHSADYLLDGA